MKSNNNIKPYLALARQLDKAPLGAPQTPELLELLQELFSPQEATLAAQLPFKPTRVNRLAEQLDQDPHELDQALAQMAERGLLYQRTTPGGNLYCLLPVLPGMAELQFMSGEITPQKERLAGLFEAYYRPGIGRAMVKAKLPYSRVIPVGRAIAQNQEILPHERAEEVLKAQDYIALTTCYCRQEAELLGKGCGKPKDVCLVFGPFAEYTADKGFAKPIDLEEALKVLERAEEAGLVHVTDNVAHGVNFMCNCCGCCCLFLKTITELDSPGAVAQASFLAEVDGAECTQCEACLDACQVGAIRLEGGPAMVDPERCLGCGLCQSACAFGAIEMIPRESSPPAPSFRELVARLKSEEAA